MGSYQKLYKSTETQNGEYKDIDVILRYENNGLDVRFVYNKSGKIDGLWINYYPFEEENVSNDRLEEVDITIGKAPYAVDGKLTLPIGAAKPPVVILVQGSGTHDMDETIGAAGNKPFRDLALGLAEQGIASIRYHERYFQYPELGTVTTIEEDLLADASEAVSYAATCDKVDSGNIYVLGHSLGGMMAPKITQDHTEVAGIICLAGSPRKLEDISYDQQMAALDQTAGISALQKITMTKQVNAILDSIKNLKGAETEIFFGYPSSYWYSLNQIDTPKIADDLKIPILICQGSKDFQVYPDKDYTAWQELFYGHVNVTFRLYENLNHLFMPSSGKNDITDYNPKANVDQQVIDDVAGWIKQN
jgi:dienelactone hydrolase